MSAATVSAAIASTAAGPPSAMTAPAAIAATRAVEVGEHVGARPRDVQALALGARQRPEGGDVDERADDADDDHDRAVDVGRRAEAPHALDGDDAGEHEQRRAVDLRREDLGAPEAERVARRRRGARRAARRTARGRSRRRR